MLDVRRRRICLRYDLTRDYRVIVFLSFACFAVKKIMAKLKLDLHEICKNGKLIEKELNRVIDEATEKRISLVEIIPGKGSGQLKKSVLRFLDRPDIKKRYHRINKDSKNFGRVFVHFKHWSFATKPLRHKEKENLSGEKSGWVKDIVFSKMLCNRHLIQLA